MSFWTRTINRWQRKGLHRLRRATKNTYQLARPRLERPSQILFIIGCQRSGTTLMTEIFEKDWHTYVYPEHSQLSNQDALDGLRLNPLAQVKTVLSRSRYPLLVLKPLVETQNAPKLLDYFSDSRALWMYRDYSDAALSNIRRFGLDNGIKNLRYIAQNLSANWRAEGLTPAVQALVQQHFTETMDPYDAAALFWHVRNQFFFELGLDKNERVLMCRYNDLVTHSHQKMSEVYDFVERPFPGSHILSDIHSTSVGKGSRITLSTPIQALCTEMLARLDAAYQEQNAHVG